MTSKRAAIYTADTWHVDDGVATDGSGRPLRNPVRRSFSPEYKLAILAEFDGCSESGEKGALLRREGLYSSIITDWRRQHRQGLLKAAIGRSDGGRGGPSLSEVAKLRAENERLRVKLAQAEAVITSREKCTRSWKRSPRARPPRSRDAIMDAAVEELTPIVGIKRACEALGRSRASHYRQRHPPVAVRPPAPFVTGLERARSRHGDRGPQRGAFSATGAGPGVGDAA
jgi:transposase